MLHALTLAPRKLFAFAASPYRLVVNMRYRLNTVEEDAKHDEALVPREIDFRHISFTYAVIALSARMARTGSGLSRDKYLAFRAAFPLSGGICGKIRNLFALACRDTTPTDHYVSQILHIYPGRSDLFVSLVERLFTIASAGSTLDAEQERMLARIAHKLGLTPSQFTDMCDKQRRGQKPHQTLGLAKRTPRGTIKKRYHELMRRYHPDHFAAESLSPELELLLQLKTSEINNAYRHLTKRAA